MGKHFWEHFFRKNTFPNTFRSNPSGGGRLQGLLARGGCGEGGRLQGLLTRGGRGVGWRFRASSPEKGCRCRVSSPEGGGGRGVGCRCRVSSPEGGAVSARWNPVGLDWPGFGWLRWQSLLADNFAGDRVHCRYKNKKNYIGQLKKLWLVEHKWKCWT